MPHPSGPNAYPSAPGNYPSAPDQSTGAATLAGTGALSAAASAPAGSAALAGSGTLTAKASVPAGAAALTATGTLTAAARVPSGAATLAGAGVLTAAAAVPTAASTLAGTGALTAAASVPTGAATLAATGTLTSTAAVPTGAATLTGTGALAASAAVPAGAVALTATGALAADGTVAPAVGALLAGAGALTAAATLPPAAAALAAAGLLAANPDVPTGSVALAATAALTGSSSVPSTTVVLAATAELDSVAYTTALAAAGLTGTGTLAASTSQTATGTAILTGTATLAVTVSQYVQGAATLTATGVLAARPVVAADPLTLTAVGALTAGTSRLTATAATVLLATGYFGLTPPVPAAPPAAPVTFAVALPLPSPTSVIMGSHGITARITAYLPGGNGTLVQVGGLIDGSVSFNATQNVRRTASLTFTPTENLWPYDPADVLSAYGTELAVEYGIVIPGGQGDQAVAWVPLMRGPVQSAQRTVPTSSGGIAVAVSDRCQGLADDRIQGSRSIPAGTDIPTAITRLVQDTYSGATVRNLLSTSPPVTPAPIDVQQDRLGAINTLATSVGAAFYTARDLTGDFVLAPVATLDDTPAWTVTSGQGGTLISTTETADRTQMFNAVIASGQNSTNTPPVSATVYDLDGASPTYYGGPAGRKPRYYTNPLLTTVAACTAAAQAILEKTRGNHTQLGVTMIPNPYVDVDQVMIAAYRGRGYTIINDTLGIPLTPGSSMSITTRGLPIPPESQNIYNTTVADTATTATPTATATTSTGVAA